MPDFASGQVRDLRLGWALEEAELPYEIDLVPFGTQSDPKNMARRPFGQVPVMTVGGETMFESGACLWRIGQESGALLPEEPVEARRCLSWLFGALNTLEPPISTLASLWFFETMPESFGLPDGNAATTLMPAARVTVIRRLEQVGDALEGREFIVGDRLSIAEIALTAVMLPADWLGMLEEEPRARAYFERHTARPAFAKARARQVETHGANAARYTT